MTLMHKTALLLCAGCLLALPGCGGRREQLARLNSGNPATRNRAIVQLGILGHKQSAPVLKKFLAGEYPRETRLLTLKALGDIGDPGSVEPIVPLLADSDPQLKLAAAEALGRIRDAAAVQPLARLLNDPDAQLTAIWALGNIGHTNAVPFLSELLTSPDKFVRYNAMQALKKIGAGT